MEATNFNNRSITRVHNKTRGIAGYLKIFNMVLIIFLINIIVSYAADERVLTDLFDTEAFRGSWRWFDKINWVGQILNVLISGFCFVSLFSLALQTIITLTYFSMRPFWDKVDTAKKESASVQLRGKNIPFGIGGMVKESFMPTKSGGLDSIFNLIFIFLPNVKQMSEMGDDRDNKLNDDDGLTTWFLKTFPQKVLLILLLSMGFNGTLMKAYGMVVDGCGVFTERVVNYQLDDLVTEIMDSGTNYSFNLADTTQRGEVMQDIAEDVYKQVLIATGVTDTIQKQGIGQRIQNQVRGQLTMGNLTEILTQNNTSFDDKPLTDEDLKYLRYNCVVNSDSTSSNGELIFNVDELSGMTGKLTYYIHITPYLSKRAQSHSYFEVDDNK